MWARIESGVVREITDLDPAGRFHPSLTWVACGDDVQVGWIYDGEELATPDTPAPSLDDYQQAVEAHVEATARARDYSSAVSCASYIGSTNATWAAEAAAFVAWRDDVWEIVFAALETWQGGGEAPTIEGLIASLPVIEWPS